MQPLIDIWCNRVDSSLMHKHDKWRAFLLPRLRRGEVSVTQAALVAGVTRQAVSRWCKTADIRIKEAEARYVLELRLAGYRWMSGVSRTSKAELQAEWQARYGQD